MYFIMVNLICPIVVGIILSVITKSSSDRDNNGPIINQSIHNETTLISKTTVNYINDNSQNKSDSESELVLLLFGLLVASYLFLKFQNYIFNITYGIYLISYIILFIFLKKITDNKHYRLILLCYIVNRVFCFLDFYVAFIKIKNLNNSFSNIQEFVSINLSNKNQFAYNFESLMLFVVGMFFLLYSVYSEIVLCICFTQFNHPWGEKVKRFLKEKNLRLIQRPLKRIIQLCVINFLSFIVIVVVFPFVVRL